LFTRCRYVERNALEDVPQLCGWPRSSGGRPHNWVQHVNRAETDEQLAALRRGAVRPRSDWALSQPSARAIDHGNLHNRACPVCSRICSLRDPLPLPLLRLVGRVLPLHEGSESPDP
jgi:hypothetical protein